MTMLGASSCCRKKYRENWNEGWERERQTYKLETPSSEAPKYKPTHKETNKKTVVPTKRTQSVTSVPLQSTTPVSPLVPGSPAFDPDYKVEVGSQGIFLQNSVSILKINLLPGDYHAYLKEEIV